MTNPYYNHSTYPAPNSPGSSAQLRAELDLVTAAFDKLPSFTGNANKLVVVNSAATALTVTSTLTGFTISGGTINNTVIGGVTPAAGSFTNLTVSGTANLGTTVVIAGGTINNTTIGGVTPAAGAFTTVSAASGFTGNLSGNVTGTVTGNVTGNLTGNVTGNVTAGSGTSTFNNVTISGSLDMDAGTSNTIINLAAPTNSGDAATKGYVDTGLATKLNLSGGTMSGAIAMGTNKITGLGDPSSSQDAATKTYVDTADALKLSTTGGTMSGAIAMGTNKITGLGDPTANQDAATKAYVDNTAQGLDAKASAVWTTTGNINLSGLSTQANGEWTGTLTVGDRILVKNQNTAADNGIYTAASSTWSRSSDANTWAELVAAFVFVEQGAVNANNGFVCTASAGGTLGSTAVNWVQFSGAGQITAGAGMTKTGNTLDVVTASSSRIVVNSDSIDLATTGVTGGTYRSVTVDTYGRVTGGTNPTTISGYGITDAYTKTEVDTALSGKLSTTGGTMSGAIAMGTSKITGLGTPTADTDASTKKYADDGLALKLNLSGGTMSGAIAMGANKITGMADPTLNQDAATKAYVDSILGSATSAATSAAAAAVSASNAATSEGNALTYAGNALTSANNAAASYDAFDDRYLGSKASDPTLDNDGNPLLEGALYWNTGAKIMKVYDGAAWQATYLPAAGYLPLSGGTMTGPIAMGTYKITGLGTPTSTDDAATKAYVDTASSGKVTSVSVTSANGFAGTSSGGTTPALTISTSIIGVLKGNGTALSAATAGTDYLAPPSGTAILKANSGAALANAVANTDYLAPALANTAVTGFKTATFNSQTVIATTTGAITVNWTTAQNQKQTEPTGSITYTFTAPPGPCHLQLLIDSDGTSTAQTFTWPGTVIWLGATWAATANKKAIINFWYDGTNYYAVGTNQV